MFPPVLRPEKFMLTGGSGCDPITSSPLISPCLWESRLTHLKVWWPSRPFRYCNAAGWSTPLTFVRFLTKICEPLLALLFSCHSCALPHKAGICKSGGVDISFPKSISTQLEFPKGNFPGYVCNHGSPRERDTASQGHTSGIPTRAMLHS